MIGACNLSAIELSMRTLTADPETRNRNAGEVVLTRGGLRRGGGPGHSVYQYRAMSCPTELVMQRSRRIANAG